ARQGIPSVEASRRGAPRRATHARCGPRRGDGGGACRCRGQGLSRGTHRRFGSRGRRSLQCPGRALRRSPAARRGRLVVVERCRSGLSRASQRTVAGLPLRRSADRGGDDVKELSPADASVLELVDRLIHKGVVLAGEATISVAGIDLIYLGLNVVLAAAETIEQKIQRKAS